MTKMNFLLYNIGNHEWPSFKCRSCTYGFNLDWKQTNLQKIFYPTAYNTYNKYYNQYNTATSTSTSTPALADKMADAFIASNTAFPGYYNHGCVTKKFLLRA